jgi:hypothetical protein
MLSLNRNARTVTLASLVYLAVASTLFTSAFALASGDPEPVEGTEPNHERSTAFIMGDVATLHDAKDVGEAVDPVVAKGSEVPEPRRFDFIFETPSRTKRVAETMFPMSWDVPLVPSTHAVMTSMSLPRRSLRPCNYNQYADLVSLTRFPDGDAYADPDDFPPWGFPSRFQARFREGFTTWVVCVDVIALLVTVVALVIITVLAMLLLDLCLCCFGARDAEDGAAETADTATETLLPTCEGKPAKQTQTGDDANV